MGTTISPVDHRVGGAVELIVEATGDEAANDRRRPISVIEHVIADAPFDALLGQSAVDALDDIVLFAERPQGRFGILRQAPLCGAERLRQAEPLQFPHAPDHCRVSRSPVRSIGLWAQVDDAFMPRRLAGKRAIELGPALRLDLSVQTTADFDIAPLPEFQGHKVTRAGAQALADVVPRYHQVMAIVAPAAHDDVDVWDFQCSSGRRRPIRASFQDPARLAS